MSDIPSHETPILLLLPPQADLAAALAKVLARPEVRHVAWPPLWQLDGHGLDLAAALPDVQTLDASTLPRVVETLRRLAAPEVLEAFVARRWQEADSRVRDHYLDRSAWAVMAGTVGMGAPTRSLPPPPAFRRDRIFEAALPIAYRLVREASDDTWNPHAPLEEGTVCFHAYDPQGRTSRAEAGLDEEGGPVLELYAYEGGRPRHRVFAEAVAATNGWRVVDPATA